MKIVDIFFDRRASFIIIIYSTDDDIRGAALVSAWMTTAGSSRFDGPKMAGSINKIDHLGCRMDRQRMMGEARSWRDKSRHFASKIQLSIGCFREQRDHKILQRDHADAKLH